MRGSTNSSARCRSIDNTNFQIFPTRAMRGSTIRSMRRRSIDRKFDEAFPIKVIRVSPNSSTRHRSIDNDDEVLPMKTTRGLDGNNHEHF